MIIHKKIPLVDIFLSQNFHDKPMKINVLKSETFDRL